MKKELQHTILAAALAAGALSLVGCNNDNGQTGVGGTGANGTGTAPASIRIGNDSKTTYARAVLVDQNGNVLAEQEIDCKANENDCQVLIPNLANISKQQSTLLVKDKQGHMIRALQSQGSSISVGSIYPSNTSTGLYLVQQLEKGYIAKAEIPSNELYTRLEKFFQDYKDPNGHKDLNEILGRYYSKQQSLNSALTEAQFLEGLSKHLKNWDVAKPNELPAPPSPGKSASLTAGQKLAGAFNDLLSGKVELISSAHAQEEGGCSQTLVTFIKLAGDSASSIPYAGGFLSGIGNLIGDSCSTDSDKLNQINSRLITLQESVNSVGEVLHKAKALGEAGWINSQTQEFKKGRQAVVDANNARESFLTGNQVKDSAGRNVRAKTYEEWFRLKGGYRAILNDQTVDGKAARTRLIESVEKVNAAVTQLQKITTNENLKTFFSALNSRCREDDAFAPGYNLIATRQTCNNAILANATILMASEAMLLPLLDDTYKTLEKYSQTEGSIVYNDFGFYKIESEFSELAKVDGVDLSYKDYGTAISNTRTLFKIQQKEFEKDLTQNVGHGKGYFEAYNGLPVDLVTNIGRVCGTMKDGKATTNPAIIGWYMPTGNKDDKFIVTSCQLIAESGSPLKPINAPFYYANKNIGTDVINVLGVLVDKQYVTKGLAAYDNRITWENGSASDSTYLWQVVFKAPKLLAYSRGKHWFNPEIINDAYLPANESTIEKPVNKVTDGLYHLKNRPGQYFYGFNMTVNAPEFEFYTWLLFKDKEGLHHVVSLAGKRPTNFTAEALRLSCKTAECSVGGGNEYLVFKDTTGKPGLVIDISYMNKEPYIYDSYVYQLGPLN